MDLERGTWNGAWDVELGGVDAGSGSCGPGTWRWLILAKMDHPCKDRSHPHQDGPSSPESAILPRMDQTGPTKGPDVQRDLDMTKELDILGDWAY